MDQRGSNDLRLKPGRRMGRNVSACVPWTVLLPDAAEGLLSDAEQRALDGHLAVCPECTEAQRGLAWLTVLKDQPPEPPVNLLASILAQTTAAAEAGVTLPPVRLPVALPSIPDAAPLQGTRSGGRGWFGYGEGIWSNLVQPRLALTGAMAFFSICLTLNLLGIPVSELKAQSFRQGGLRRSVADKGASLVRSFQGLRVVYRVESHVNEMRAEMNGPEGSGSAQ